MKKKIKFLLAIIMMLVALAAQAKTITVTITPSDFRSGSFTKDGVTVTGDIDTEYSEISFATFSTTLGNFTKIVVNCDYCDAKGSGWSGTTWTGNASSVSFEGGFMDISSIVFTIDDGTSVDVTGVTLSQTSASMTVGGETLTLTATVAPDDATDKTVTWATSDAAVATVADGVVTAVGAGTATITVTATNGTADTSDDKTATCTVTVTAAATQYDLTVDESLHGTVAFTVAGAAATQAKKDDVVTVTVTPAEGYSTKDVTVRAYTSWDAAPARGMNRAPGLLDEIAVTKNETDGTWTFTMPEANVWVVATYTKNVQDAWIEAIADQTYTGSAIEPTVTVKDGDVTLTLGTDYTVSYSNNVETGTATVTVTGTGGYSGEATATFTILADKSSLNDAITEAEAYYESIKESNPEAAEVLKAAIDAAKEVQGDADATQAEVEAALAAITTAEATAEQTVMIENSRVTITIPAKSYVARIDADKRQIETAVAGVSLYTVSNVNDSEVVLSDALNVVAAAMPYLIYNDNDEEVEVSIVLSTEEADAVEYDSEHFKGTLTDKTFTAEDMAAADHYVLSNGQDFVWVKDAGTLAAGKCWIELPASPAHARRLAIVHEGTTTGIAGVSGKTADHSDWYDLSGRRVMQPTKGLYIARSADGRLQGKNCKKVVVK